MKYRNDIQILRGIAVSLVVLFHLSVTGFASGFLGVDVFFVISGYLMALLYDPNNSVGFYLKRMRRLLPAYFAVIMLTLIAAFSITVPSDYGQVTTQAKFAGFFASNIGFWLETTYFDNVSFKPLQHLWSLGVEIQFYLLVPIVYQLIKKHRSAFYALGIGSALLCFCVVGVSPKTAFYWLPLRLWQFFIGFAIALPVYTVAQPNRWTWVGLLATITIVGLSTLSAEGDILGFVYGHPGLSALLISLATGVTLFTGLPIAAVNSRAGKIFAKIGDYSYSIYLTHFPIIVLLLYKPLAGTLTKPTSLSNTLLIAALIAIVSVLLYHLIEQPGRKLGKQFISFGGAVATLLVAGSAQVGAILQKSVIPSNEVRIYQAWEDRDVYRCGKLQRILHPTAISCEITVSLPNATHRILLVGNSHADSIKRAFAAEAEKHNASVFFMVDNEPLMKDSNLIPEVIVNEAKTQGADTIVLHYSPGAIPRATIERTALLTKQSGMKLDFIMPVPVWQVHIPSALIRHVKLGEPLPQQDLEDYHKANGDLIEAIANLSRAGLLKAYDVANYFCKNNCKLTSPQGEPLYFDQAHLTLTGSQVLRGVFDRLIAEL